MLPRGGGWHPLELPVSRLLLGRDPAGTGGERAAMAREGLKRYLRIFLCHWKQPAYFIGFFLPNPLDDPMSDKGCLVSSRRLHKDEHAEALQHTEPKRVCSSLGALLAQQEPQEFARSVEGFL